MTQKCQYYQPLLDCISSCELYHINTHKKNCNFSMKMISYDLCFSPLGHLCFCPIKVVCVAVVCPLNVWCVLINKKCVTFVFLSIIGKQYVAFQYVTHYLIYNNNMNNAHKCM